MTKTAAIIGFVNSMLALLIAFGVDISDAQQAAITVAVAAKLTLLAALLDPRVPFGRTPDAPSR